MKSSLKIQPEKIVADIDMPIAVCAEDMHIYKNAFIEARTLADASGNRQYANDLQFDIDACGMKPKSRLRSRSYVESGRRFDPILLRYAGFREADMIAYWKIRGIVCRNQQLKARYLDLALDLGRRHKILLANADEILLASSYLEIALMPPVSNPSVTRRKLDAADRALDIYLTHGDAAAVSSTIRLFLDRWKDIAGTENAKPHRDLALIINNALSASMALPDSDQLRSLLQAKADEEMCRFFITHS